MSHLRKKAEGGALRRRLVYVPLARNRPRHSGGVLDKLTAKAFRRIADFYVLVAFRPVHLKGCNGRVKVGGIQQRIRDSEIVKQREIRNRQRGQATSGIYNQRVGPQRSGPKQSVGCYPQIKIMKLITEVRGRRPQVEIDSNKDKASVVMAPIQADVFTRHEAHVGVEDQWYPRRWNNTPSAPGAVYLSHTGNTVEVGDRRGFFSGTYDEHMEHGCARSKWLDAPRNRPGIRAARRQSLWREAETGARGQTRHGGCGTGEIPA